MSKSIVKKAAILLQELVLSLGAAACIGAWASKDAMLHGPNIIYALQPLAAAIIWWIPSLLGLWLLEAIVVRINRWIGLPASRAEAEKAFRLLYLCFAVIFQPVFTYFSFGPLLLVILLSGSLYRHWRLVQSQASYPTKRKSIEEKLEKFGDARAAAFIAAVFALAYLIVASAVFAPLPQPGGDEPHYLTATYSMLTDGDLLLTDNYAENDYALWHEGYIQPHTKAGTEGVSQQFPMHNVGLSAYLVPFMAAGLALGGKAALLWCIRFGMVLLAALFIALLYMLLVNRVGDRIIAVGVTSLAGLTSPVLFYSYHVFTEIPTALLLTFSLHLLLKENPPNLYGRLALGMALGALPWLGIKYFTLAATFVVIWIYKEFAWGFRLQRALVVAVPGLLLGLWFFITTHAMFGTYNPAAYQFGADIQMFSQNSVIRVSLASNFFEALGLTGEALLAYLIGQHQGLLFYAPWMLIGIAGLARMLARGGETRRTAFILLILALPFIIIYGITGLGGGHSPSGRTMLPVLWFFLIPAGWILKDGLHVFRQTFAALIFISLIIALVLLINPPFLYHDFHVPASNVLSWLGNPHVNVSHVFPSLFNRHFVNLEVSALWLLAITLLISCWAFTKSLLGRERIWKSTWPVFLAAALIWFAWLIKTPPLSAKTYQGEDVQIHFQYGNVFIEKNSFWIQTSAEEHCYIFGSQPLEKLDLRLRSATPNTVIVDSGNRRFEVRMIDPKPTNISIPLTDGFTSGNERVIRLRINSISGNPEGLSLPSGDRRPLGAEIFVTK